METRSTLQILEAFIIVYSLVFLYMVFSSKQYFLVMVPLAIILFSTLWIYRISKEKDIPRQLFLLGGIFLLIMGAILGNASDIVASIGISLESLVLVQVPIMVGIILIVYYLIKFAKLD